jgi:hypothetical protein
MHSVRLVDLLQQPLCCYLMEQSPEEISKESEAAQQEMTKLLNDAEKLLKEDEKAQGTERES